MKQAKALAWTDSYVYYMSTDAKQKQRSWEFMEWLSGPEAGLIMAEAGIWTPALPEVWEEMGWTEDPVLSVCLGRIAKRIRVSPITNVRSSIGIVWQHFRDVWTNYVELGDTDIAGYLAEAVPQAQACLDDNYASLE